MRPRPPTKAKPHSNAVIVSSSKAGHGPGRVLVGDAGSFLDPLSTYGITDALRDAETLARAGDDLDAYARDRDRAVGTIFDVADRIAGYDWDSDQVRRHLLELSSAMSVELELITAGYPAASADSARAASRLAPNLAYE